MRAQKAHIQRGASCVNAKIDTLYLLSSQELENLSRTPLLLSLILKPKHCPKVWPHFMP